MRTTEGALVRRPRPDQLSRHSEGSTGLPRLLDCRALRAELGVSRSAAEAIMRDLPIVHFDGLRKVYVRRDDVARLIAERTFTSAEVPR